MDPLQNMQQMMPGGFGQDKSETNLFSILINIIFGFILGLMFFFGPKEIISYGSKLAGELIKLTGYGQQASAFGFAKSAAPFIILAPIGGMVVKQLTSVRTLKSFGYFLGAVIVGFVIAFFMQGYFSTLIK